MRIDLKCQVCLEGLTIKTILIKLAIPSCILSLADALSVEVLVIQIIFKPFCLPTDVGICLKSIIATVA